MATEMIIIIIIISLFAMNEQSVLFAPLLLYGLTVFSFQSFGPDIHVLL